MRNVGTTKVINDDGEFTGNINQKKESNVLQWPVDVHSMENVVLLSKTGIVPTCRI